MMMQDIKKNGRMVVFPTPMNSNKFILNTCYTTLRNCIPILTNYNSNSEEINSGIIFSKNLRVTLCQQPNTKPEKVQFSDTETLEDAVELQYPQVLDSDTCLEYSIDGILKVITCRNIR